MIKLVALVRKRADLTDAAFAAYWLGIHAPLAAAIPGMRGYRINIARDPGEMPAADCDGSAEIWFDSRAAMEAGLASAEGVCAGEDVAAFASELRFLVTDEHVILAGPA